MLTCDWLFDAHPVHRVVFASLFVLWKTTLHCAQVIHVAAMMLPPNRTSMRGDDLSVAGEGFESNRRLRLSKPAKPQAAKLIAEAV